MNFMKNVRTQFTVVDNVFHYIRLHQITMDLLYVIRKISPTRTGYISENKKIVNEMVLRKFVN